MLYMHQEFGSGERRAVCLISSSPYPLLSNEARGFAQKDDQAERKAVRKLQIDLASVPLRKPGAPNLINFINKSGGFDGKRVCVPALYNVKGMPKALTNNQVLVDQKPIDLSTGRESRADTTRGREISGGSKPATLVNWSVGKNREMFLRKLKSPNVTNALPVSPLEDMTYTQGQLPPKILIRLKKRFDSRKLKRRGRAASD